MRIEQATGEDCISIHALHEESDSRLTDLAGAGIEFQSTLSMRRATVNYPQHRNALLSFQSTLSMRRATAT